MSLLLLGPTVLALALWAPAPVAFTVSEPKVLLSHAEMEHFKVSWQI